MTPTLPEKPRATGRGIKIALGLSLAVNLAVAGVVGGFALRTQGGDGPSRAEQRDAGFAPFTQALTREQRRVVLSGMAADRAGLRRIRAEMAGDVDRVVAALRADPFVLDEVERALTAQATRLTDRADAGRRALVDLVGAMSAAERADFVKRLQGQMRKPRTGD